MVIFETTNGRVVLAEDFKSAVALYHQATGEYPDSMAETDQRSLDDQTVCQALDWDEGWSDACGNLRCILDYYDSEPLYRYIELLEACLAEAKAAVKAVPTTAGVYEKVHDEWLAVSRSVETNLPPADSDADGWIKWTGGKCPVRLDQRVEVMFRVEWNGQKTCDQDTAGRWSWWQDGDDDDIVAYRVIKD